MSLWKVVSVNHCTNLLTNTMVEQRDLGADSLLIRDGRNPGSMVGSQPPKQAFLALIPRVLAPGEAEGCWESSYLPNSSLQVHMVPSSQVQPTFFPSIILCSFSSPFPQTLGIQVCDKLKKVGTFLCPVAIFPHSENPCFLSFRHGFLIFKSLGFF